MALREQSELRRCLLDVTTNIRESFYNIWRMITIASLCGSLESNRGLLLL